MSSSYSSKSSASDSGRYAQSVSESRSSSENEAPIKKASRPRKENTPNQQAGDKKDGGDRLLNRFYKDVLKIVNSFQNKREPAQQSGSSRVPSHSYILNIDHFKMVAGKLLGQGNFGEVFSVMLDAEGTGDGGKVAAAKKIKVMENVKNFDPDEDAEKQNKKKEIINDAMQEFNREAENLLIINAAIEKEFSEGDQNKIESHNYILTLKGVFVPDLNQSSPRNEDSVTNKKLNEAIIVTEFCDGGGTLEQFLREKFRTNQTITWRAFVTWSRNIAMGLAFLNRQSIIHRDISAKNIMLQKTKSEYKEIGMDRIAKIIDFGLSRKPNGKEIGYVALNQNRPLPIPFIGPENLYGHPYNHATDLWGVGVTIWQMSGYCKFAPYQNEIPGLYTTLKASMLDEIKNYLLPNYDNGKFGPKDDRRYQGGKRLQIRRDMPKKMAKILTGIFQFDQKLRPSCEAIQEACEIILKNETLMEREMPYEATPSICSVL